MRKKIFLITIYFLFIFLSVFFGLGYWNENQAILRNGDPFPSKSDYNNYTLTGARISPLTGRYHLEFPAESYDGNFSLIVIQVNSSFEIFQNGQLYYQYEVFDPYKRIQQIPLTKDFYDAEQQKVIIEFTGEQNANHQKILLGLEPNIGKGLALYTTLQLLFLGALSIMLVYAISLFIWKPSERYLCVYILYTALQLIWGSLTLLPQYTNSLYSYIIETIINELSILVALLTVIVNLGLLNIQMPHPLKWLNRWYGVVTVYLVVGTFAYFNYSSTYEVCQYSRLFAGTLLLIYACAKKKKGALILLTGYAVSQGMLFFSMITDWGYTSESIYLSLMRATKFSFLPFTFSIMLFINFKFASKYRESEQLAMELKDINKSLDLIVEVRTNEVKRLQALRHNMMLNVFHDLRSPLFVLKGCADMITAEPAQTKDIIHIMKERIDFLTRLTDDLFLFEQLEDDKVLFASEQVDLYQLLQTIISASKIEAAKKDIALQAHLNRSCLVWGDQHRIGQAIQNLIVNAIYYTPRNGRVNVDMKKNDHTIHISIEDTGKGISKEDIGKVFDRYYHNNDTDPHQSTGLGLSIAQEIIRQHHGTISVTSTVGIGSTFMVVLPLFIDE